MAIARFPRRADGSSESGVAIDAVNAIGPDDLVAQIVVICISDKATDNPNATVEPDDLIAFERRHGRIPERALVCMNSGWANTVNDGGAFGGGGGFPDWNFPGFSIDTTDWLVTHRDPVGIGSTP
jgi:kynurenine formamidase